MATGIPSYRRMWAEIERPARTLLRFEDASHDASAEPRERFFGTPAEIVADLEACAAAGVDELNIEPSAP